MPRFLTYRNDHRGMSVTRFPFIGWLILSFTYYIFPTFSRSRPEEPKYSGLESFLVVAGFHNGSRWFDCHSRRPALWFSKGLLDRTFLHHSNITYPYKNSASWSSPHDEILYLRTRLSTFQWNPRTLTWLVAITTPILSVEVLIWGSAPASVSSFSACPWCGER